MTNSNDRSNLENGVIAVARPHVTVRIAPYWRRQLTAEAHVRPFVIGTRLALEHRALDAVRRSGHAVHEMQVRRKHARDAGRNRLREAGDVADEARHVRSCAPIGCGQYLLGQ